MIVLSDPDSEPAQSQASAIIHLEARDEERPGVDSKYTGEGHIAYRTGPLANWEPCTALVRGEGRFPFESFKLSSMWNSGRMRALYPAGCGKD